MADKYVPTIGQVIDAIMQDGPASRPDRRSDALTDEIGAVVVDTCRMPENHHLWETAIQVACEDRHRIIWIAVEQYPTKEVAYAGHTRWVQSLTEDEFQPLVDIYCPSIRRYSQ